MQAAWGAENGAPTPSRGAELYGEVGTYVQSTIESVPWYLTRKEKLAAKNPKKWDEGWSTTKVQVQTTKRPAEMDVVPQGVKVTTRSLPGYMTMADHDHGVVWPPQKGQETALPFMSMVNAERDGLPVGTADYRGDVNGIMIGYQGHVPRARDKIGSCPLGNVPGRPGAPSLSKDPKNKTQSTKTLYGKTEPALYVSEAHDPQLKSTFKPGQRIHASVDPSDDYKGGVPPGYAGHVHGARYQVGQSVFSTADTYGHADSQGATAKQFSSHNDARGATYEELASIYGNNFVADGIADDPRDSFVKVGEEADWILTDDIVSNKKIL